MIDFDFDRYQEILDKLTRMTWTLSRKKRIVNGRQYVYLYKQYFDPIQQKRRDEYVRRKNEQSVLQEYQKKQQLKEELHRMNAQIRSMDRVRRKRVKGIMLYCERVDMKRLLEENEEIGSLRSKINYQTEKLEIKHVAGDGTLYDSREEIALDQLCRNAGLQTEHNEELDPEYYYTRKFDFSFSKDGEKFYWEHFGKISDPVYARSQKRKLDEYAEHKITQDKNLIVTLSPNEQFIFPLVLRQLMIYEIIEPSWVIKEYKLEEPRKRQGKSYEIWPKRWY